MTDCKYKLHRSENGFGCRSNQDNINEGLGEILGNRSDAINQFQKSENNCKTETKVLNKKIKSI